jgi:hypothetical protein
MNNYTLDSWTGQLIFLSCCFLNGSNKKDRWTASGFISLKQTCPYDYITQ